MTELSGSARQKRCERVSVPWDKVNDAENVHRLLHDSCIRRRCRRVDAALRATLMICPCHARRRCICDGREARPGVSVRFIGELKPIGVRLVRHCGNRSGLSRSSSARRLTLPPSSGDARGGYLGSAGPAGRRRPGPSRNSKATICAATIRTGRDVVRAHRRRAIS